MEPIKVLVVDDSYFMRSTISKIITSDRIQVIDTAKNGKEAVEKVFPDFWGYEREAIGYFYDTYYQEAAVTTTTCKIPYQAFRMESLNSENGQDEIFSFLGLSDHVHLPVHYHVTGKPSTHNERDRLI